MTNIILYTNYTYIFLNIFKLVKHIPMEVRRNGIQNSEGKPLGYPDWHEKWFSCSQITCLWIIFLSSPKDISFSLLLESEGGKEKYRWEREALISCPLCPPRLGIKSATQVSALTGDRTLRLLMRGQCSNQLNTTSQGCLWVIMMVPMRFNENIKENLIKLT